MPKGYKVTELGQYVSLSPQDTYITDLLFEFWESVLKSRDMEPVCHGAHTRSKYMVFGSGHLSVPPAQTHFSNVHIVVKHC